MEQDSALPEPPGKHPTGFLIAEVQSTRCINPLMTCTQAFKFHDYLKDSDFTGASPSPNKTTQTKKKASPPKQHKQTVKHIKTRTNAHMTQVKL